MNVANHILSPGNLEIKYGREFSHFKKEINGRLNEMNETINAALPEHKASSQRASSKLKQEILSLQRSVEGILKAMEDKPASSSKNKEIPSELLVRNIPAKYLGPTFAIQLAVKSLHEASEDTEQFNAAER